MHILRGIRIVVVRMMMVQLVTRATCHCEMCVTCFPEGGVPTLVVILLTMEPKYNDHDFRITQEHHVTIVKPNW